MKQSELRQLTKENYEYIKALNIIATELIHNGEIIHDIRFKDSSSILVIKNDNIEYTLQMYGGDTCKCITWERRKE